MNLKYCAKDTILNISQWLERVVHVFFHEGKCHNNVILPGIGTFPYECNKDAWYAIFMQMSQAHPVQKNFTSIIQQFCACGNITSTFSTNLLLIKMPKFCFNFCNTM